MCICKQRDAAWDVRSSMFDILEGREVIYVTAGMTKTIIGGVR